MTTHSYISPFDIFNIRPQEMDSRWASVRADLQAALLPYSLPSTARVYGHSYSKKQFIQWIDELDNPATREYHTLIANNKPLYNFLEYGHLGIFRDQAINFSSFSADFLQFIKYYFAYQYCEAWLQAVKTENTEAIELLQNAPVPFSESEKDEFLQPVQDYLTATTEDLQKLVDNQQLSHISERELRSYLSDKTIAIFNLLPDSFATTRNWIGNTVGHLAMYMTVQLRRPEGAEVLVRQALKLKLDEGLRNDLEQLLEVQKSRFRMPAWAWLGMGVVALLFLLKYIETTYFVK